MMITILRLRKYQFLNIVVDREKKRLHKEPPRKELEIRFPKVTKGYFQVISKLFGDKTVIV